MGKKGGVLEVGLDSEVLNWEHTKFSVHWRVQMGRIWGCVGATWHLGKNARVLLGCHHYSKGQVHGSELWPPFSELNKVEELVTVAHRHWLKCPQKNGVDIHSHFNPPCVLWSRLTPPKAEIWSLRVCLHSMCMSGAWRCQKRVLDPLRLNL